MLAYRYRLFTTAKQEAALDHMLGAFCDLYNAALQQRIEAYRRRGLNLRFAAQAAELKAVRAADDRLAGYSFDAETQVLRRLDKTYSAFFGRVKAGKTPGFPRFRAKSRFNSAEFRVGQGLIIRKSNRLGIVGIPGDVKVKWHRDLPIGADLKTAVISRKAGKWFACFHLEADGALPNDRPFSPVGVDMGLTSIVALSTGETVQTPQFTKLSAKPLRRAQRAVSRKRKGSERRRKAKLRVAKLSAKIANKRRDFSHKLARSLSDRFTHIAFEDLNTIGLASGPLAKAVHNAAWNQLVQHVTYKAANAGGWVALVDPRGTSQTCPECGAIARKTLAVREHRCECGCVLDRDVAAARVILMRADFQPGRGCQALSQRVSAQLA